MTIMPKRLIIGLDESGWGAYAGPFTVGCAIYWSDLPASFHKKIKDSKRFSTHNALRLGVEAVKTTALYYSTGVHFTATTFKDFEDAKDRLMTTLVQNAWKHLIGQSSALNRSGYSGCDIIIDGEDVPPGLLHESMKWATQDGDVFAVPKADSLYPAVSAASILAKYLRDEYMIKVAKNYPPEFKLESNKGYHSKDHMAALKKYGALDIHHPYIFDVQQAIKEKGIWKNGQAVEGH